MCGEFNDYNGTVSCGLNLCCSYMGWCGTSTAHCANPDAACQQGYGLCEIIPPPSCTGGGQTAGRKIGYYPASNVRGRRCNRIDPEHIRTEGLTHMNFAFASINPTTFEIVPWDVEDVALYSRFTALKTPTLQTWIAIGGYDFSNPEAATHTTW